MLEIIDKVLKAEQEAEQIVSQAKEETSKATNEFEQEEREQLQQTRSQADQKSRNRLDEIRSELRDQYDTAISEAQDRAEAYVHDHDAAVRRAISRTVDLLTQTETTNA